MSLGEFGQVAGGVPDQRGIGLVEKELPGQHAHPGGRLGLHGLVVDVAGPPVRLLLVCRAAKNSRTLARQRSLGGTPASRADASAKTCQPVTDVSLVSHSFLTQGPPP